MANDAFVDLGAGWLILVAGPQASNDGSADLSLSTLGMVGGLDQPLSLSPFELSGTVHLGVVGAFSVRLPPFDALGAALAGQTGGGSLALLPLALAAGGPTSVALLSLPLSVSSSGLAGGRASLASVLRPLNGDGLLFSSSLLSVALTLPALSLAAQGVAENLMFGQLALRPITLASQTNSGQLGLSLLALPALIVNAEGYTSNSGVAVPSLPWFDLHANAQQSGSVDFLCLVMNTSNAALTTYSHHAFNSLAIWQGLTLAAGESGIVTLGGDADSGSAIVARVQGAITDFGANQLKRIVSGHVGYRSDGDLDLTLIADDHAEYRYVLEAASGHDLRGNRVKCGRGAEGRYWQFRIENRDGGNFSFDDLTLIPELTSRLPV
jgi:hypothetical protein